MTRGPLSDLLLDGRYRIGDLIGSGGFGHVYAAMHVALVGKVAVKVPRIEDLPLAAIPEAIAKFMEEGRTLKRLRHPHLVAALDLGLLPPDGDGIALPYLVLEWCEGTTLREWRAERPGTMPATEAWLLLKPVFDALAHAHAEGVVHRDLKPGNIIMEELRDGSVSPRVIDFGIAKIVPVTEAPSSGSTRTTSEHRSYTPRYAAPEQLTGMRTGPRTDVYALALLLLETIMGRPVFAADADARRTLVEGASPTLAALGLDLGGWNPIVARALALKPADRYADAGELLRALEGRSDIDVPVAVQPPFEPPATTPSASVRTGAPASGGAVAEDTVVPSSHTLRTARGAGSGGQRNLRWLPVAGAVLATALAAFAVWWHPWRGRGGEVGPPIASASAGPEPGSSAASSTAAGARRPLRSLSGAEMSARATRGGLSGCNVGLETAETVQVVCGTAWLTLTDDRTPRPPGGLRALLQSKAKTAPTGGQVARFTTQASWSLLLVTSAAEADRAIAAVVEGIEHEGVGTERAPTATTPVPKELGAWKGPELAARVVAIGGTVISDDPSTAQRSVVFVHQGASGMAILIESDAAERLELIAAKQPYVFARDGAVTLAVMGPPTLRDLAFIQSLLGDTTAREIRRRP